MGEQRRSQLIERGLREALRQSRLDLHYQPIFDIDGRTLIAFESLLRWRSPGGESISPAEFIPIAERGDLIHALGAWVLRRACDDVGSLGSRYVGVNVSAAEIRRRDFALGFAAILAEKNVDAAQITIEITETVPLHDGGTELANLHALRSFGCWVAMDDFGAGHAKLESLRRFPFNVVKIDKSYIGPLAASQSARSLVRAICEYARTRDIVVVAEGVETEDQLRLLKEAGCTRVQGNLLGRPAPASVWSGSHRESGAVRVA